MGKHITEFEEGLIKGMLISHTSWRNIEENFGQETGKKLARSKHISQDET